MDDKSLSLLFPDLKVFPPAPLVILTPSFLPRLLTAPLCPLKFGRSLACRVTSDEKAALELPFYHSSSVLPAPERGYLPARNLRRGIIRSRRKPNWDLIVSQAFGRGFALRIT